MSFVVDASATLPWCFSDEQTPATRALLMRAAVAETLVVPDHWAAEVLNVLIQGQKRGRISETEIGERLMDLGSFNISVDRRPITNYFFDVRRIAQRYKLTAYDAAYLELAVRRRLPLATLDRDLATAAIAAGVPLLL